MDDELTAIKIKLANINVTLCEYEKIRRVIAGSIHTKRINGEGVPKILLITWRKICDKIDQNINEGFILAKREIEIEEASWIH